MIVMKFGGTSVGDVAAIIRLVEIVKTRLDKKPVVVVSAISKATDMLQNAARLSEKGELATAKKLLKELETKHITICKELLDVVTKDYEDAARLQNTCSSKGIASTAIDLLIVAFAVNRGIEIYTRDGDFEQYQQIANLHRFVET